MRTATRCKLTTSLPFNKVSFVNLVEGEENGTTDLQDGCLTLDFRPFEIKTIRLHS
jgi:hypothetical protein